MIQVELVDEALASLERLMLALSDWRATGDPIASDDLDRELVCLGELLKLNQKEAT